MASLPGITTSAVLLILLMSAFAMEGSATPVTITNRCSYTVWPAVVPAGLGKELLPGSSWSLDVPVITAATNIWGRTGCSFDGAGRGRCQTGDCGGLQCAAGNSSNPAVTKAEFSVYQGSYYYGITTLAGFNLPLDFSCSSGDALRCRQAGCPVAYPYQKYYQHTCGTNGSKLRVIFCP